MLLQQVPIRILKAFYPDVTKKQTMKQLSEASKVSREPIYRYLQSFVKVGYVIHEKIDNLNVFSLNLKNPDIQKLFEMFQQEALSKAREDSDLKTIAEAASQLGTRQNTFAAILFYPGDKEKRRLIYVTPQKMAGDYRESLKLSFKYQGSLSPTFLTLNEFTESLKQTDNLKVLLNDALIIFGFETVTKSLVEAMG